MARYAAPDSVALRQVNPLSCPLPVATLLMKNAEPRRDPHTASIPFRRRQRTQTCSSLARERSSGTQWWPSDLPLPPPAGEAYLGR